MRADRVEQVTDDTVYDVWVAWDEETFNKAVARTKQLLGVGLREAKQVVEQGGGRRRLAVVGDARRRALAGLERHQLIRRLVEVHLGVRGKVAGNETLEDDDSVKLIPGTAVEAGGAVSFKACIWAGRFS